MSCGTFHTGSNQLSALKKTGTPVGGLMQQATPKVGVVVLTAVPEKVQGGGGSA
ncbi:hypothetical protein [Vibrio campbellii]|uniref:Uncharacterized protein n=1 Tax=Vibrio campbellii TaxID=680 RepID=A0ABY5ILD8_9VIBR|nr:hypothetical protein [Vibrio campbellii]UTZ24216.1 hypothetical protein HB760_20995 [Vibrio campbellii]UTZ33644.1 hypothetical protein HB762_20445 [Vibrio campbellii]